jgi:predicted RND superfamily exporter protein
MSDSGKKSLWFRAVTAYVGLSYRRPWIPLVVIGLLTWGATWFSGKLTIDTDLRVLLPNGTPSKVALQEAESRMGSTDLFTLAMEAPDAESLARFQADIADSLKKWPEVIWAQYDQPRTFFEKHALLYLPVGQLTDLRDRISGMIGKNFAKANPLIEDLDEGGEKPTLQGWPNADSLRKEGLPKDLVDALLAKLNRRDAEAERQDSIQAAAAAAKAGDTPAPPRPDSLKSRLMGWHPQKKVWVAVVLGQLNKPSTDAIFAKGIYDRGEKLVASMHPDRYQKGLTAEVAGAYRNFSEINQVNTDIITAGIISFVLMVGLLWFFVRKVVNLVLVNVPLLVAMSWTTGVTYLIYQRLTMLTAFILALILGLGIEYTVHLYSRWAEENREGRNPLDAMTLAVHSTGRSLLSGAATNIFAMLSLQVGHFKGFKEFGVVVSIGITFALLTTWLVIPPLFFFFVRISEWVNKHFRATPFVVKVTGWLLPGGNVEGGLLLPKIPFTPKVLKALGLGGLIFTLAVSLGPTVHFENDFAHLRGKSTSTGISYGRAVGAGRNTSPSLILGKSEDQMRSVHDSLAARYGNPADSMMQSFATIQSFVPATRQQVARKGILEEIRSMLDARALQSVDSATRADLELLRKYLGADTFSYDSIPDWSKRFLTEADGSHGRFGYLYGDLRESDALESQKFQDRFGTVPSKEGPVPVASSGFIYADVVRMVKHDGVWLGLVTLLFLIVITWLDMRNWRGVFISVGFIVLSAWWTFKIMGILDLRLGMFNLVVLPTILSVSVDSVIHLYHRRLELGAGKITELYHTTGSAVLTGTLNNAFGFLGLCFVSHKGMQTIGFLATLGIGSGLVIMFTILPWALEYMCPKEPQHE